MSIKTIITLGPATRTERDLRKIKSKGIDFVRVNMSHSNLDDLRYFIALSKKVGIPFIIDTEGSQIRSGTLESDTIYLKEDDKIKIYKEEILGNTDKISLKPNVIVPQLEEGDILYLDFDALILRVCDTKTIDKGYVIAQAITSGVLGRNKSAVVDSAMGRKYNLPPLSEKDYKSIALGLEEGIKHVAASFMRSGSFVDEFRRVTKGKMKIISKIECIDAIENLDDIISKSDYLLLDRGDLSKEIPIEKIPFFQKVLIERAKTYGKGVFVATNLLETMIEKKHPTRAETHDVVNTILEGAHGLVLAAETAVGKYPMESINMLNKLIRETKLSQEIEQHADKNKYFANVLKHIHDPLTYHRSSSLIEPHGGVLVDRIQNKFALNNSLENLPRVELDEEKQMDVEQIALGVFSPLEGFMCEDDFNSVISSMRLKSGVVWPLPIVLDVSNEKGAELSPGSDVALTDAQGEIVAVLHLEEKYTFDKRNIAEKIYGTNDALHPGVGMVLVMKPILLGGKISLLKRKKSRHKAYELTPRQTRRMFEERGWARVVGFHTRNVIHRGHEFIQLKAMEDACCDGLLVHPIVGKKKRGDFSTQSIVQSYEIMKQKFYPKDKVLFATFSTFSRYGGPREALFTAICRKNFGCSHFIVGRDHTGVRDYYKPEASHEIFNQFPDIGVVPIKFGKVFYSKRKNGYVHENDDSSHTENDKLHISGTEMRKMLERGEGLPEWYMRPEISSMLAHSIKRGDKVFVQ